MSGSVVPWQPGSVLKSMVHVATEGLVDAPGQVSHLKPHLWLRDMLHPGPFGSEWLLPDAVVMSELKLQLRAMSGSVTLMQPGSVLIPRFLLPLKATWMPEIWGHISVQEPCCHWDHADLSGRHYHLGQW